MKCLHTACLLQPVTGLVMVAVDDGAFWKMLQSGIRKLSCYLVQFVFADTGLEMRAECHTCLLKQA